ncbi:hypothetical protein [Candidatus Albibeggiatoa sp. nov. NOAA]|uniref:hypothetical protein n=1 Tax=Candidatus Albibeggiatoa sp. nov. NOAA TaxID=3162724 RepID=UPI0032F8A117|nr:hypothetical protein [Thiotrichaceae bacterium]
MNNTNLLAFLLTLQTQNVQHPALKQLLSYLQLKPLDWPAIQSKIDTLLMSQPHLKTLYNQYQTQLEANPHLLNQLPALETFYSAVTRSALPPIPDESDNTEIANFAVAILRNDDNSQAAKQLLQDIDDQIEKDET